MTDRDPVTTELPEGRRIIDFGCLNGAEIKIVNAARQGAPADFGKELLPCEDKTGLRTIRAEVLRFLALGGDSNNPVHEKGVHIIGACIRGDVDLEACRIFAPLTFEYCYFSGSINLRDADIPALFLEQTYVKDFDGDRLCCRSSLHFHYGCTTSGPVRFVGAKIAGDLDCRGAKFESDQSNISLECSGIEVKGDVLLGQGFETQRFEATGETRFSRARIAGSLECSNAILKKSFWLENASIDGDLDLFGSQLGCVSGSGKCELILSRAKIGGRFFLVGTTGQLENISLRAASCGAIVDDETSWSISKDLILDGFQYERFIDAELEIDSGKWNHHYSPTDADTRIRWLNRQRSKDLGENFKPQPWEQLVKILREMGHNEQAKMVAIEKQRKLYNKKKISGFSRLLHCLYGWSSGYGYRPGRIVTLTFLASIIFAVFFWWGEANGVIGPADGKLIYEIKDTACRPEKGGSWTRCPALAARNMHFNPLIYSFDVILPIIGLQQAKEWTPLLKIQCNKVNVIYFCSNASGPGLSNDETGYSLLGLLVWLGVKIETVLGWIAGLMFVAVVGGFVKKD